MNVINKPKTSDITTGPLPASAATDVRPLPLGDDGALILPGRR